MSQENLTSIVAPIEGGVLDVFGLRVLGAPYRNRKASLRKFFFAQPDEHFVAFVLKPIHP